MSPLKTINIVPAYQLPTTAFLVNYVPQRSRQKHTTAYITQFVNDHQPQIVCHVFGILENGRWSMSSTLAPKIPDNSEKGGYYQVHLSPPV